MVLKTISILYFKKLIWYNPRLWIGWSVKSKGINVHTYWQLYKLPRWDRWNMLFQNYHLRKVLWLASVVLCRPFIDHDGKQFWLFGGFWLKLCVEQLCAWNSSKIFLAVFSETRYMYYLRIWRELPRNKMHSVLRLPVGNAGWVLCRMHLHFFMVGEWGWLNVD